MPVRVITASPRSTCPPNENAAPFSGWPSKRSRKISDQATVNPQLAGRSGDIATSFAASVSTQPPSDPSRGQLAPPSASTVASASTARAPSGVANNRRPSSSQPVQRCRSANCTPMNSSRRSHARSSGEALNASGKTRPLEPTKVGCPSASLHRRSASGGKAVDRRRKLRHRPAVARKKCRQRLAVGQVESTPPRQQKLAADGWHGVIDRDTGTALRQHFGCHQAGGPGADDGDWISGKSLRQAIVIPGCASWRRPGIAYSLQGFWIPGSLASLAPRNDDFRVMPLWSHHLTASRPPSPPPARHISGSAGTRLPALWPSTCR